MTKIIIVLSFIIVYLQTSNLISQELPQYLVNRVSTSLTIDGVLDDADWALAETTSHFVVLDTGDVTPANTTWAKVLWDDDYLYVAFYCEDTNVWATINSRDGQLYTEDAVEVYLDPDADGLNYLEFELNPLEAVFDLWLDKPWDEGGSGHSDFNFIDFYVGSSVFGSIASAGDMDSAWTCEIALSYTDMTDVPNGGFMTPLADDVWNFNLYRFDRNSTNDPNAEQTGWSQTGGGQHVPEKFGSILFVGDSIPIPNAIDDYLSFNDKLTVLQNYPNPFSVNTTIEYKVTKPGNVTLKVMDLSGRIVYIREMSHPYSGKFICNFSAEGLSAGSYFYTMQNSSSISTVKKMIVVK